MKPLIKWPGGKSTEIKNIVNLIPRGYDRFIEPFVGGGAVYFYLSSQKNIINDIDFDLITFYKNIKSQNNDFFRYLKWISKDWKELSNPSDNDFKQFHYFVEKIRSDNNGLQYEMKEFTKWVSSMSKKYDLQIPISAIFLSYLLNSIISKLKRVVALEKKYEIEFNTQKLMDHFETAIKGAYYMMLRDERSTNRIEINARFFFIREFCYGSMFRYNQKGKFNIPYGGINYNTKSFEKKVNRLKDAKLLDLFHNTKFFNMDFNIFLETIKPTKQDFIFFDPPYDSDFKDYGKSPFNQSDQERLAHTFTKLPSQCIMIINKTEFLFNLYTEMQRINPKIEISDYEKIYTYNVRGRNNRDAKHLLITNFPQNIKKTYQRSLVSYLSE